MVRLPVPLVAAGLLVVAAVGFGIWLWSVRSVTDPIDADPVDAYAVVMSSPSCASGAGNTVVELAVTPPVRSSVSACGHRVGERVAVQYLQGHPDQARLSGTTVAHADPAGRWLPIAILAAGLLAVIATVTLLVERRASRHAGSPARVTVAQLRAGASTPAVDPPPAGWTPRPAAATSAPAPPAASTEPADNPDVTSRVAMPGFPGATVQPFRPSEIAVDEDLFTHHGVEPPDR
ncbi:hypothetical protein SAMN04515671_0168 [Nakamurella panacisegetis]|uniref:Uncharacterized protein n=2 Tax=Nakamurella panacisegetis TaxID=1090615 RepID=A0A1H0HQD5_9ACTN|nr:hypothetical protein SAMN04515671_0168 [Nakamurella panacisegetis]